MLRVAESVQRGMMDFGYEMPQGPAAAPAVTWFRAQLDSRLAAVLRGLPPSDRQTSL
jgi:hypothetical protein